MDETNPQIKAAVSILVNHIKRCFATLVDGTPRLPRRRLNHWMSKVSKSAIFWGYPIITKVIVENCATAGINLGQEVFDLNGVYQIYSLLKAVEQPLFEILLNSPAVEANVTVSKWFDPCLYTDTRFNDLSKILADIRQHDLPGVSFFLHGSMADLKYTAFSDVDDLVILRKEMWHDPNILIKTATSLASIARGYQGIDPFQHHGHWVITEFNLLAYDESILPLVVLNDAVRVTGEIEIPFRVLPGRSGFIRNAENSVKTMQRMLGKASSRGWLNAFELKGLVGEIAIMPAYLFQANGVMLTKPEAIQQAMGIFSTPALEALAWATFVRDNFAPLVDNRRTKVLQLVANLTCPRRHQAELLFRKYAMRVSNQHELGLNTKVQTAIETFIKDSMVMLERLTS